MLSLLYLLLVLNACVWSACGYAAHVTMRDSLGKLVKGERLVIILVGTIAVMNLFLLVWFATGQVSVTH